MNFTKIEELFVDYILHTIGPTEKTEIERINTLESLKEIITKKLNSELKDYITYVIPYGSFPVKSYLKSADIDITICFWSKKDKKILINIPMDYIDKTIKLIKDEFENRNKNSESEIISEIKIIMADIRLLKCKMDNINIDISINNFAGLYKIIFINLIEEQIKIKLNNLNIYSDSTYSQNKRNLLRRTFLLIKGWFLYEGKLMGSNIGLMATYTLEILVLYLFNFYYKEINNEFEGFMKFFEMMEKFNWQDEILSLFGLIRKFDFHQKLESVTKNNQIINKPFWYLGKKESNDENRENLIDTKEKKESLLNFNEVQNSMFYLNRGIEYTYLINNASAITKANFDKFVNVLDPLNNYNNLGKSINFHSKSRMDKVVPFMIKKLKNIKELRKNSNPFFYMNSLLNLFKDTLTMIDLDLFEHSLKYPKILVNSKVFTKFIRKKGNLKFNIDKSDMDKFNSFFQENNNNIIIDYNLYLKEEEDSDEYEEDKQNNESESNLEEEDEDIYEEDEINNSEDNNEESEEDNDFCEIKENVNFEFILDKEILKNLFYLYENKEMSIKYNNIYITESKKYSNKLEKFLQEHKLI